MKIKNCPFCGGEAELWDNKLENKLYCVICRECECMTPLSLTEERVVELWNTRKPMDEIVKQLESEANKYRESGEDYGSVAELGVASGILYAIDTIKGGVSNETD